MEIGAQLGLFGILAITDARTPPVDQEFVLFAHDLYQAEVPSVAHDIDMINGGAFLDNTPPSPRGSVNACNGGSPP
jgi:hypothetical protein